MPNSGPQLLGYEPPPPAEPPTRGVTVADHGDHLIITGPTPRPLTVTRIVFVALLVAASIGWTVYGTQIRYRAFRFGLDTAVFTLALVAVWCVYFLGIWRGRRPRVTEITPEGVTIPDHLGVGGSVHYPRHQIRCLHLVHGKTDEAGLPVCTLRMMLRRRRGDLSKLFHDGGVVILTGPAAHLREIGDRIRQVLDHEV